MKEMLTEGCVFRHGKGTRSEVGVRNGGAAAHLHGPAALFDNVYALPGRDGEGVA